MVPLKRFLIGLAWVAVLVAGVSMFPARTEAVYCVPNKIPVGFYPTGVPCSPGCASDLHTSRTGATFCVIYGRGGPLAP
jgi:hypothetical protein